MKYATSDSVCPIIYVGLYESELSEENLFSADIETDGEDGNPKAYENWFDRFDSSAYREFIGRKASEKVAEIFDEYLKEGGYGIVGITSNGKIIPPRYHGYIAYNFDTDHLELDVEMSDGWKRTALEKIREWSRENGKVARYVEKNFTSYDGFISYIPNSLEAIAEKIEEDDDIDRMAGVYAALCLCDAGYFDEDEFSGRTPLQEAVDEMAEDISCNHSLSEFLCE